MKKKKLSRRDTIRTSLPEGSGKVLLHSCCAPCSGSVIEDIQSADIDLTIFFYNPNIHPREEYTIRKNENIRYARKLGIPFIDGDYDTASWYKHTRGHENDPERGERCRLCFEMRFFQTAKYAHENGFKIITSSLGISRWKDFDQVTRAGMVAASFFQGISYWSYNWRKIDGSQRMVQISREENFYKQEYCGCSHSLRDTNLHRLKTGREKILIGKGLAKKP